MKAKFLYAYKIKDWKGHYTGRTELTYEYRGYEYTIVNFGWTGLGSDTESLYTQHQKEQKRIDEIIEEENHQIDTKSENADIGLEMFWKEIGIDDDMERWNKNV